MRNLVRSAALAAAVSILAAGRILAVSAPATALSETPGVTWQPDSLGLMIQVSSVARSQATFDRLAMVLEEVRTQHRDPSRPGFINNLVLQDIAPSSGDGSILFTPVLDLVAPYFPHGARASFDNVFVGTMLEPSAPAGSAADWSPYSDGITDARVRDQWVAASMRAAGAFAARYPTVFFHWYVSWEAWLPAMMYSDSFAYPAPPRVAPSAIRAGYLSLLTDLASGLSSIRDDRAFLWSPALDRSWKQVTVDGQAETVRANLSAFFAAARSAALPHTSYAERGFLWLLPQDGLSRPCLLVGGGAGNTISDRIEWFSILSSLSLAIADLSMNAELFDTSGCPEAAGPAAVLGRLQAYQAARVPIGTSFDWNGWAYNVLGR